MIEERLSEDTLRRRAEQGGRKRGNFIAGPIPVEWICSACRLPGKALAVALAVWFKRRMTSDGVVPLTTELLKRFGVSRSASYRAVDHLEAAGLVSVDRQRGRCPRIQVREAKENSG